LPQHFSGAKAPAEVLVIVRDLHQSCQALQVQEDKLHDLVCQMAQRDPFMRRVAEVPGYGPIRSATLVCYLDTPWRFASKTALWKYVGIGLKREKSGDGPPIIKVEQACNRLLRNVTIGAAVNVIKDKENVFARRYHRWIASGLSPRNARRNVARDLVTVIWGMWKTDTAFDPRLLHDPEAE
jgi:transposase